MPAVTAQVVAAVAAPVAAGAVEEVVVEVVEAVEAVVVASTWSWMTSLGLMRAISTRVIAREIA